MAGSIKRLYSFGFLFGARDQGAVATTEKLSEGMDSLRQNVESVGKSTGGLQRFGNALSAITIGQLSRVNSTLSSIAERAGAMGPQADDTSAESFGAQYAQSFRQATAGMGAMTEQMNRYRGAIGGVAYDLGVDAGDMVQGIRRFVQSGDQLEDYGLNVRAMAGSMQAGILSSEQLGNSLTSLAHGYNLGAEGAQRVLDRMTALGEGIGAGSEFARALPNVIQAADGIIRGFPPGAAPGIEDVTESITRLARATVDRLGGDANVAMEHAIATFVQLGGQRRQLRDLVSGVSSDFPELAQEIGIASGDIDGALQSIMSDPITFAESMHQLMGTLDESDPRMSRMLRRLDEMPDSFGWLVTGGDEATAALERARVPVENITGAFARMARGAASSGRTFGESMSRLEDNFKTNLNSMTTMSNREVLGRQREAYRRVGETIDRLRSGDGPVAGLTQAFLDFRRHGVIGLVASIKDKLLPSLGISLPKALEDNIPLISDMAEGVGGFLMQAAPLLLVMTQIPGLMAGIGTAVGLVLSPWVLLVAGIAAAIYYWDDLLPLFQKGGEWLKTLSQKLVKWVDTVDWAAMAQSVLDKLKSMFASFGEGGRAREIMRSIAGAMRNIFSSIGTMLGGLSEGIFGSTGGGILNSIFGFLWDSTNIDNLMAAIEDGDWADILYEGFMTAISPVYRMLRVGVSRMLGFDAAGAWWNEVLRPTFEEIVSFWTDEISPVVDEAGVLVGDVFGIMADAAVDFWEGTLKPVLIDLYEWWDEVWTKTIKPKTIKAFKAIGEWAGKMWTQYIRPMLFWLARVWVEKWSSMQVKSIEVFSAVLRFGIRTFTGIQTAINQLIIAWVGWREILKRGWELIGTAIRNSVGIALEYAHYNFTELVNGWEMGLLRIKRGFLNLPVLILDAFRTLVQNNPLTGLFARLGINIGVATGALDDMRRSLTGEGSALAEVNRQIDNSNTAAEERGRLHNRRMTQMRDEISGQVAAVRVAYQAWDTMDNQAQTQGEERLRSRLQGVQEFEDAALEVSGNIRRRLQKFVEGVESGRFAREAAGRRSEEAAQSAREAAQAARPVLGDLERAASRGRITNKQHEDAVARIMSAVTSGGSDAVEAAEGEIRSEFLTRANESRAARRRRTRRGRRRRPRVRAQAAEGGGSPAQQDRERRRSREEERRSAQQAQAEMTIDAFGSQAVRQLREAFSSGRAGGSRRGRHTMSRGPESAGDTH